MTELPFNTFVQRIFITLQISTVYSLQLQRNTLQYFYSHPTKICWNPTLKPKSSPLSAEVRAQPSRGHHNRERRNADKLLENAGCQDGLSLPPWATFHLLWKICRLDGGGSVLPQVQSFGMHLYHDIMTEGRKSKEKRGERILSGSRPVEENIPGSHWGRWFITRS